MQQNTDGAFKCYDYTYPNNVYSGGVISQQSKSIFCKSNTAVPAYDDILMRFDDTYAYFQKFNTRLTIYTLEECNRPTGQAQTLVFKST